MVKGIQYSLPPLQPLPAPMAPTSDLASARVAGSAQATPSFKEFMLRAIDEVNSMQQDADRSVEQLLTGGEVNPAEVLTAVQKADMSFRMMLQVRNKLMQAFQEIKEFRI